MPVLYDPTDEPTDIDDVVVIAAKRVYYTELPKSPEPVFPGDVGVLLPENPSADPPPPDPLDDPQPQNCNDLAFLLQEAEQKKSEYHAARQLVEGLGFPDDVLGLLAGAAAAANLFGIGDQLQRYIKAVEIGNQVYATVKAARAGWPIAAVYFVLWVATRGTEGRWDARIALLKSLSEEWNCDA